jgi:hypothetical protein
MKIEDFAAEIICNIYSFLGQKERSRLRRTCKNFYLMFNVREPQDLSLEWKKRLTVLLGIGLVEKLARKQIISFGIPVLRVPWEEPDKIFFHLDPRCRSEDNFRVSFLSGAGGQTLNYIKTNYKLETQNMYVGIKTPKNSRHDEYTCGLFKFVGCPENPMWQENVDFVSLILVDTFFMFSSRLQYKNSKKMINYQLGYLIEKIVDNPEDLRHSLFEIFDKSSIMSDTYSNVFKDFPISSVDTDTDVSDSESTSGPSVHSKYIYQSIVDEMIWILRQELKTYFYDGRDARVWIERGNISCNE